MTKEELKEILTEIISSSKDINIDYSKINGINGVGTGHIIITVPQEDIKYYSSEEI